jgi:hypothetical protein
MRSVEHGEKSSSEVETGIPSSHVPSKCWLDMRIIGRDQHIVNAGLQLLVEPYRNLLILQRKYKRRWFNKAILLNFQKRAQNKIWKNRLGGEGVSEVIEQGMWI